MTARRCIVYIRSEDIDDYEWAKLQREKYSGCVALGLKLLRKSRQSTKKRVKKNQ